MTFVRPIDPLRLKGSIGIIEVRAKSDEEADSNPLCGIKIFIKIIIDDGC